MGSGCGSDSGGDCCCAAAAAGAGRGGGRARRCRAPPPAVLPGLLGEVSEDLVLVDLLVGGVVLPDADVRLARVAVLVERDRTGLALVVDVLAVGEELRAVGEGLALRAALGHGREVVADRLAVRGAALERREGEQGGGVV